ncbi:MAG: hypothetical protein FWH17_04630 [Oscillospiraceae bacterium]|nr:hypothetical protein [Oscillospiraceae bacterium]
MLRFLRYSFENPAPDGKVYSEWLSYHFRWFDHDGNEIDMEHFRRYSYFYYDDSRERGYYSRTHDETRYWGHGFRGGSSDTNLLINFDDETFEWADIFVEDGSYNKYTIDSNIYTVY